MSLSHQDAARVVGTVAYMAPGQRDGQRVDQRADLYACGVMLFEMRQGRLPALNDRLVDERAQKVYEASCRPRDGWAGSAAALRKLVTL